VTSPCHHASTASPAPALIQLPSAQDKTTGDPVALLFKRLDVGRRTLWKAFDLAEHGGSVMNLVAPCQRRNQSDEMPDRTTQRPAQRNRGSTTVATGQQERGTKCPKRSDAARRRRETDPDYGKRCRGLVGTEVAWAFPHVRISPEKTALKNRIFASEAFRQLSPQLREVLRELLYVGGAKDRGKTAMVHGYMRVVDLASRLVRGDGRNLSPRQTSRLLGELERRGWIATAPILPRPLNRGIAFVVFDSPSAGPATLTGDQLQVRNWPRRTRRKGPDQSPMTGPDQSRMTGPDQSRMSGPEKGLHEETTPTTTAGPRKASVEGAEVRLVGGGTLHAPEHRTSEPPVRVTVTADPPVRLNAVGVEDVLDVLGTLAWVRSKTNVVLDRFNPGDLDFLAGQSIATVSRTWKACGKTAKNPAGVFVTRVRSRNMETATGGSEGRIPPLARIDPEGALVAGEDRKRIFASIRETIRPGGRVAANP